MNSKDTAASQQGGGALAGVRVLELSNTVAGPFCGRLFADFGAEVIKVEPARGDDVRNMGKRVDGHSLYAASILRNKSLLALDLRTEKGQALARRLAAGSDLLIENFRPGTLERWNLGYETLVKDNPALVLVRISGYGQTGPYRERAGYGVISEALSGLRHMTGEADRPPPRVAVSLTDYITGLYAAFGAMVALSHARATGQGQVVDAALYESAFSFMEPYVPAFAKLGTVPSRSGSRLPNSTPNNLYPCADGGYLCLAAPAQANFRRLCTVIGNPALAEAPRFESVEQREDNVQELDEIIGRWCANLPLAEAEHRLHEAGVPASKVATLADIFADPQYAAREMLQKMPHDQLGEVVLPAVLPKLSATPGSLRTAGGAVGRDTLSILSQRAGLNADEIAALAAEHVVTLPEE